MIVVLAILVVAIGIVLRFSNSGRERLDDESTSTQFTTSHERSSTHTRVLPRRAQAPPLALATQEPAAVDFDWHQAFGEGFRPPKLPREEVEKYLERNNRHAVSLLTAYRALSDTNYLLEAAANFPNDPRVLLSVLMHDVFPAERRQWLERFKTSSPDNSLASYLSAWGYFRSEQTERAIDELLEATRKPAFNDFAIESRQEDEELNLAAGRTPLQSKIALHFGEELMAELAKLKWLCHDIVSLQKQYLAAGDAQSAERVAQIGLGLAHRLNSGDSAKFMINQLSGASLEALTLEPLNPNASFDFLGGKTPNDRMEELKQQREPLKAQARKFQDVYSNATEAELLDYYDRRKLYGDVEAMRWLLERRGAR